ncbi:MAG TPA: TAT-variant-translocated molybdopterin oxidoreductase, partial [Chitinophagales bacterium]|nr:TAT-variant-translocated molybdopterin oxidoreductase [Chitinophagales bacterium]
MEQKNYWKGLEELHEDPAFLKERDKEFAEELPVEEIFNSSIVNKPASRRDFLKMARISRAASTPLPSGKRMSSKTRSGFRRTQSFLASAIRFP